MRKIKFENDKYYHIYNRGVDKRKIFLDEKDFARFIVSMREFNIVDPIGSLYWKNFKTRIGVAQDAPHPIGCGASKDC